MRAICLVKHLEFDFSTKGGMMRDAVVIGDIDNDGCNELVVGNTSGDLCVFKNTEQWQKINRLGMITGVAIGDILNCGKNALVVISGDGWCHIFCCMQLKSDKNSEFDLSDASNVQNKSAKLECVHKQRIPANSKVVLLDDIDGDGKIEMVLGLTDRVVRSYRWCDGIDESKTTICDIGFESDTSSSISGKLVGLNKWESGHQIGAVTLQHTAEGNPTLLVAQPGGTFMRIRCQPDDNILASSSDTNSTGSGSLAASYVDYQFLGSSRMRNQNISTEVIGDIKQKFDDTKDTKDKQAMPYSVATLDGTIMLVREEVILWSIQVDHQIFALEKLDIIGDGAEEIVACSWDGQTYIIDQNKNCVRFQLEEPVQGFCCGYYNISEDGEKFPCLVYVTFKNKICLYYDFQISTMVVKKLSMDLPIFTKLEEKIGSMGHHKRKQVVEWLLYGSSSHSNQNDSN